MCIVGSPHPEGIDQSKWERIKKRGISWGGIYETLFPGWPIPCSRKYDSEAIRRLDGSFLTPTDFEEVSPAQQQLPATSTAAQELINFQHFMRRETMRLVEARILPMISAEIEERLGDSITRIVDSCQSTAMQNYQQLQTEAARNDESNHDRAEQAGPSSVTPSLLQSTGPSTSLAELSPQGTPGGLPVESTSVPVETSFAELLHDITPDSGYHSGYELCFCDCHWSPELGTYKI